MLKNKPIFYFFLMAFRDILRPKVISVLILPFLFSLIFWGTIAYLSWGWLTELGITLFRSELVQSVVKLISNYFVIGHDPFVIFTKFFFILFISLPLIIMTYLLLTSIFLVPLLVEEIRKTDFPSLVKKSNSFFTGTTASLSLSAKYFFMWIGTSPLWLIIPGGSIIVPFLLLSWFNSRLFSWEVMVEISSKEEIKVFIFKHSRSLWALGFLTSFLYFIPILNFIAPVITALAFSRFCLRNLSKS
jgi:CysZ protein